MSRSRLHELSEHGVSVWIDSLSREMLETGELARLMEEDAVVGVTSNPTIFQKALAEGDWYDEQLRERRRARPTTRPSSSSRSRRRTSATPATCCAPVWERTGGDRRLRLARGRPDARLRPATRRSSRRCASTQEVDRPNLYVKIPATEPGLGAIEDCIAEGALDQRHADLLARALRARSSRRTSVGSSGSSRPAATRHRSLSVASFFVSRVDTEADKRLEEVGRPDLQGKLAIANAKLAYQHWQEAFSGERWAALAAKGARPQRCLWASTSTKNPAYRDVLYVEELVGPDVVNTMPPRRSAPSRTTARCGDTLERGRRRGAGAARRARGGRASTTTTSSRRSSARACRSSPTRSRSCSTASRRRRARSPPR